MSVVPALWIGDGGTYDGVRYDVWRLRKSCKYMMLHDILEHSRSNVGVPRQWGEMQRACPSAAAWTCEQGRARRLGIAIKAQSRCNADRKRVVRDHAQGQHSQT